MTDVMGHIGMVILLQVYENDEKSSPKNFFAQLFILTKLNKGKCQPMSKQEGFSAIFLLFFLGYLVSVSVEKQLILNRNMYVLAFVCGLVD